jgi:hypothetical protein
MPSAGQAPTPDDRSSDDGQRERLAPQQKLPTKGGAIESPWACSSNRERLWIREFRHADTAARVPGTSCTYGDFGRQAPLIERAARTGGPPGRPA